MNVIIVQTIYLCYNLSHVILDYHLMFNEHFCFHYEMMKVCINSSIECPHSTDQHNIQIPIIGNYLDSAKSNPDHGPPEHRAQS